MSSSSSSQNPNLRAGWIWWTSKIDSESELIEVVNELHSPDAAVLLKKLADVIEKSRQVGFYNALGRRVSGAPVPEFLIRLPNQTLYKASADLIEGVPVLFALERSGGSTTTANIESSRRDVKGKREDIDAVTELARQNREMVVAAQEQHPEERAKSRKSVNRVSSDWRAIYSDVGALAAASEIRTLYGELGATLDQLLARRIEVATNRGEFSLSLSRLHPIEELGEVPSHVVEAQNAANSLSEAATEFGTQFWSINGAAIPILGALFGKLTPSQLKWTRARSASAASGLLVANSLLESWPMDAESQAYAHLLDLNDTRAKCVWLAQVAGVCEAQQQLGITPGTGIAKDVMRQLILAKEGSNGRLAADVVAVRAAAQLRDITLIPQISGL